MKRTLPKSDSNPTRRQFLKATAAASAAALAPRSRTTFENADGDLPAAFVGLKPLGSRVQPISPDEFRGRIEHAQKLMAESTPKFDALFCAPGTSLYYFTGIHWGASERLLGLLLPRAGDPILVVPGFEEGRLREKLFAVGDAAAGAASRAQRTRSRLPFPGLPERAVRRRTSHTSLGARRGDQTFEPRAALPVPSSPGA